MKAFISYSHKDNDYLEKLKVHLAQVTREGLITEWTDKEITVGENLDASISSALSSSQLFISLVSPDYIASNYCYEKEFSTALKLQGERKIIIIPIIVEPCEWKSTPLGSIKSLPYDGKPVSEWTNANNAFVQVVLEIRKLLSQHRNNTNPSIDDKSHPIVPTRNYKAEKTFTEVDKLDFKEKSFEAIKNYFKLAIAEFNDLENLQARFLTEEKTVFSCLISNKGNLKDAYITISLTISERFSYGDMKYSFTQNVPQNSINLDNLFSIGHDDYNLYWESRSGFQSRSNEQLTDKQIAEKIWDEFIRQVGVS